MYPQSVASPDSSLWSPNFSRPMNTEPDAQKKGKTEAVPVKFVHANLPNEANNKEVLSDFEVPIHKNNQVGIMPTTVKPVRRLSPGMAKTTSKSDSVETLVSVSHQGRGQLTQEEVSTSKGLDRAVEVAITTEPGASAGAVLGKAKPRTEMASPSSLAVGHSAGARKVESFPHGSTQEEEVKPKPEKVPTTKTFGGPRNAPRKDQSREVKEKGEDINDRVSNYISRAKIRIRTMSNAGGTKGGGQKDGVTDHFGNYIQRAKMKIRTMSGIGGDKNVQSK